MDGSVEDGPNTNYTISDRDAAQAVVPLAREIASEVLGLSVTRVTPLLGMGAVNLILCVETSEGEIIVRLNRAEDDASKVRGDYEKERWCIDLATTAGIPGPEVLAVGERSGRAFILQSRIAGVNGKLSGMAPLKLWQTLGRYAQIVHSLPVNGFGDSVAAFEEGKAQERWLRFVDYNLGELTRSDPLLALGVYKRTQQPAIREAFTRLRGLRLQIGLNHGDLARRNTIVHPSGTVYLLDWGCAEMHIVPHYDLNAISQWYRPDNASLHAFLAGYGLTPDQWVSLLPEVKLLSLLKAFDLTRWAIDRCPTRIEELAAAAGRCAESAISQPFQL